MTKTQTNTLIKRLLILDAISLTILAVFVFRGYVYENVATLPPTITQTEVLADTNTPQVLASKLLISQFQTGSTLTQYSLDNWGNKTAVSAAKSLFNGSTKLGAQHLMGFGVLNPMPTPSRYDWSTLDARMNQSLSGVNSTVLVACCAPDWMKGGAYGQTNWSSIEVAPREQYYDAYANLVAQAVRRYPQIQYVLVWNEMKGMWNYQTNRWNHESYTRLYNKVWARVKATRSSVKIGGPYVVLSSYGRASPFKSNVGGKWGYFDTRDLEAVKYWLRNKTGADFIAVDASNTNRDNSYAVDRFAMTDKFAAASNWIRSLGSAYSGSSSLPIWWAEWYAMSDRSSDSQSKQAAIMTTGLIKTIKSGAATAMIWGPQGTSTGASYPLGLFTDTRINGGGKATVFYKTQKYINDHFSKGKRIVKDGNTNSSVEAIASDSKILVVNKTASQQTTKVLGKSITLAAYQVSLEDVPRVPSGTSTPKPTTKPISGSSQNSPTRSTGSGSTRMPHAPSVNPLKPTPKEEVDSSGGSSDEITVTKPEDEPVDLTSLSTLADAIKNDQPVIIGSTKVPTKPIKYVSIAIIIVATGVMLFLVRDKLNNARLNIMNMIRGNRSGPY